MLRGFEFFCNGAYVLSGVTDLLFEPSGLNDRETTLRQSLQNFLGMKHLDFLRLADRYGALPAWGVADGDWIESITIDGQPVDEIIPIECSQEVYYLWVVHDLQTRNIAADLGITGL